MPTDAETESFGTLDPAIQKLEFKVTVLPAEEPKVQAELRRAGVVPGGARCTSTTRQSSRCSPRALCCAPG